MERRLTVKTRLEQNIQNIQMRKRWIKQHLLGALYPITIHKFEKIGVEFAIDNARNLAVVNAHLPRKIFNG